MKRILVRILAGLTMFLVALLCAFLALRVAIHGREVVVPNLAGKSDSDAAATANKLGLNLSVENRFYASAIAPNHVLSQSPAAGSRVRRGWQVRVTESLGGQKVDVPDLVGQTDRPAALVLRRVQLELGTVAHLPAPGTPGTILAQSPPPNSVGLNGPRVALLVADPDSGAESAAYVMPAIVGLTLARASSRLASAGLHIASTSQPQTAIVPSAPQATAPAGNPGTSMSSPTAVFDQAFDVPLTPAPVNLNSIVSSQSPQPGHRVTRNDAIRVTLAH